LHAGDVDQRRAGVIPLDALFIEALEEVYRS
jgi:hypothetical protein